MSEPLWKELIHQNKLQAQYEILLKRGTFTDKEIAIHLARFAEAHIFNAADKRIEELEAKTSLWHRWMSSLAAWKRS